MQIMYEFIKRNITLIFNFILVWIWFVPESIACYYFSFLDNTFYTRNYNIISLFLSLFCIFIFLFSMVKAVLKGNYIGLAITIYSLVVIMITVINSGEISYTIITYCKIIAITFYFNYIFLNEKFYLLNQITNCLNILMIINLYSILILGSIGTNSGGEALGNTYFLGFDNGIVLIVFPALFFNYLLGYIKRKKMFTLKNIIISIIFMLNIILIDSSTTIVGIFIFYILLIILYKKNNKLIKVINPANITLLSIVIFFSINILKVQSIFKFIIVDMLNKDLTFTGRTELWDIAIMLIKKSYLIGYGVKPLAQRLIFKGVSGTHNQILDVLYQTGIIGLLFWIVIFLMYIYSYKYKKEENNKIIHLINIFILSFIVMMQFESYNTYLGYSLIFTAFIAYDYRKEIGQSICDKTRIKLVYKKRI